MSFVLTTDSVITCPHGGRVELIPNGRTRGVGGYALRASDATIVTTCPLASASPPHPCVKVDWSGATSKNRVSGQFILTASSSGDCYAADGTRQGTAIVSSQHRVKGR